MSRTLKEEVKQQIGETIFINESFYENRWGIFSRSAVLASKNVVVASAIIVFIIMIAFLSINSASDFLRDYLSINFNDIKFLTDVEAIIFNAQITLLSLVFPLVIAFVGILLQNRLGSRVLWMVYKNISGFMIYGASSILLISCYLLILPYKVILSESAQISLACSYIIWFLLNLVILGRFFVITIKFVSPEERQELILRYTINDVLISDVKGRLSAIISMNPVSCKLLKKEVKGVDAIGLLFSSEKDGFPLEITRKSPSYITNIDYRIINLAINVQGKFNNLLLGQDSSFKRVVKIQDACHGPRRKVFVLAWSNPIEINFLSRQLFKFAYKFSKTNSAFKVKLSEFVNAIFAQVEDAIRSDNYDLFERSIVHLQKYQVEIEKSLEFKNDEGDADNWLLLADSSFFGRNYLDSFVQESFILGKKIVKRIPTSPELFEKWCYLFPQVFGAFREQRSGRIGLRYVTAHYLLWPMLHDQLKRNKEYQDINETTFDDIVKYFVGSWENWGMRLPEIDGDKMNNEGLKVINEHLESTSMMIVKSANAGSLSSAEWACDMLINWFDVFSSYSVWHLHYGWYFHLMNISMIDDGADSSIVNLITKNDDSSIQEHRYIAYKNYWTDIRVLTASYLLSSYKSNKVDKKFRNIIDALIQEIRLRPSSDNYSHISPLNDVPSLFSVYLRMACSDQQESHYSSLLTKHLERLERLDEPSPVSGRLYSGRHVDTFRYVVFLVQVLGIGLSKKEFNIERSWRDFLCSEETGKDLISKAEVKLEKLLDIDNSVIELCKLYYADQESEIDIRKNNFISSVKKQIEILKASRSPENDDSIVDENIVQLYACSASISSFSLATGPFPMSLFGDIDYFDDLEPNTSFSIKGLSKRSLSARDAQDLTDSEKGQIDEMMRRAVSLFLTRTIFINLDVERVEEYEDAEEFIELIQSCIIDGGEKNDNSILLIGAKELWAPIRKLAYGEGLKEGAVVEVDNTKRQDSSYIFHINNVEIHQVRDLGSSFLVSRDVFRKIKVLRFGDGKYVEPIVNEGSESTKTVDVELRYGIECELSKEKAIKFVSQ